MPTSEFGNLRHAIHELQHVVSELRVLYGGASGVRRLENDMERLEIDANDLIEAPPAPMQLRSGEPEKIYVPPAKDNEAAWMGAQDEGLGFHSRKRTR